MKCSFKAKLLYTWIVGFFKTTSTTTSALIGSNWRAACAHSRRAFRTPTWLHNLLVNAWKYMIGNLHCDSWFMWVVHWTRWQHKQFVLSYSSSTILQRTNAFHNRIGWYVNITCNVATWISLMNYLGCQSNCRCELWWFPFLYALKNIEM